MSKREVSAPNVGHYVQKLEYLVHTLKHKCFDVYYCLENQCFIEEKKTEYIPMVCFTDLNHKVTETHKKRYGSYVIKLTKDWANRKKLSPVLYLSLHGKLTQIIKDLYRQCEPNVQQNILSYCKPYRAKSLCKRTRKYDEVVRFYDEREWRYVPDNYLPYEDDGNSGFIYANDKLTFEYEDVVRVYVPDESAKNKLEMEFPQLRNKIVISKSAQK